MNTIKAGDRVRFKPGHGPAELEGQVLRVLRVDAQLGDGPNQLKVFPDTPARRGQQFWWAKRFVVVNSGFARWFKEHS